LFSSSSLDHFNISLVDLATMEKANYTVDATPNFNSHATGHYVEPVTGQESKSGRIMEAGELYGNLETAEEYGYVSRGYVLGTHLPR
jgi:hypothetical protein